MTGRNRLIRDLRRQNRRLMTLNIATWAALGLAIAAGATRYEVADTVQAKAFTLVDNDGKARATLDLRIGGPRLALIDENGKDGITLIAGRSGAEVMLQDADRSHSVQITPTELRGNVKDLRQIFSLGAGLADLPSLELTAPGSPRYGVSLGLKEKERCLLKFDNHRFSGSPLLLTSDAFGVSLTMEGVDKSFVRMNTSEGAENERFNPSFGIGSGLQGPSIELSPATKDSQGKLTTRDDQGTRTAVWSEPKK